MPPKKERVPLTPDLDAAVQFDFDRTCCVCHLSGKHYQVHHIDENPANNEYDNLAVLCLECHAQTQVKGGFGKRLSARVVRRYRDHWLSVVQMRRSNELLQEEVNAEISGEQPEVASGETDGSGEADRSRTQSTPNPLPFEGATFRNNMIEITLIDVRESVSISINESGYRTGSGYETYTERPAGPGAKFVTVVTRVLNDGMGSIDLTCGYPVGTHIVDQRSRRFDSIRDLSHIYGNPECNFALQPGFSADMTWIYLLPDTAEVMSWEFEDVENHDWNAGRQIPTSVKVSATP